MAVYVSNIVIEQGFDFDPSFQLEDSRTNSFLDLSGSSSSAILKKTYSSSSSVSFASSISSPIKGIITIALSADQTSALKPGRYVYDVKITTETGKELKAVEGSALVRPGVTT